jgi:hypothetical protein
MFLSFAGLAIPEPMPDPDSPKYRQGASRKTPALSVNPVVNYFDNPLTWCDVLTKGNLRRMTNS